MFPYIFHQILPSFSLSILYLLFPFLSFIWVIFRYSQIRVTCVLSSHIHDESYHKCKKREHHTTVLQKYLIILAFTRSLSLSNLNSLTPPLLAHSLSPRYLIAHIFFTILFLTNDAAQVGVCTSTTLATFLLKDKTKPIVSINSIREL